VKIAGYVKYQHLLKLGYPLPVNDVIISNIHPVIWLIGEHSLNVSKTSAFDSSLQGAQAVGQQIFEDDDTEDQPSKHIPLALQC
jgi:hypothetical protein